MTRFAPNCLGRLLCALFFTAVATGCSGAENPPQNSPASPASGNVAGAMTTATGNSTSGAAPSSTNPASSAGASNPSPSTTGGATSGGGPELPAGGESTSAAGSGGQVSAGGNAGSTAGAGAEVPTAGTSMGGAGGNAGDAAGDEPGGMGGTAAGGSSSNPGAPLLDQTGNPVYDLLTTYLGWLSTAGGDDSKLSADQQVADNMLTWQMPEGGFDKNDRSVYNAPWDGVSRRSGWSGENGAEIGTIDNDATVTELLFLADVYQRSGDSTYRDGVRKAFDYLLTMQYPSGGFPQVYPARAGTTYSNYVTFNDDAMARVLILLYQAVRLEPPLDGDLLTDEQRAGAESAIAGGVDFIVNAQIVQDGEKTVWCAQHDPDTYEPRGGRSYELPSKSGKESIGVVTFLMTQPQTPEVEAAVRAAIAWYDSDDVKLADTAYVNRPSGNTDDNYNPIQSSPGSTMWCRFYDLDQNVCFFSGRLPTDNPPGEGKQYDIMAIEPERRYGYGWGGSYGTRLLEYASSVGY